MAKLLSVAKFMQDYLTSDQKKIPILNLGLRVESISGHRVVIVVTARNEKEEIVFETDPIELTPGSTIEFKGLPLAIQQLLLDAKLNAED